MRRENPCRFHRKALKRKQGLGLNSLPSLIHGDGPEALEA